MYALQTYFILPHPTIHPSFLSFSFTMEVHVFFYLNVSLTLKVVFSVAKKKKKRTERKKTPNLDLISLISYQVSSHLQVRS